MENRYPAMRTAVSLLKVVGWVVMALGVVAALSFAVMSSGGGRGFVIALMGILYSVVAGILLLALGDFFRCIMDIEANARSKDRIPVG